MKNCARVGSTKRDRVKNVQADDSGTQHFQRDDSHLASRRIISCSHLFSLLLLVGLPLTTTAIENHGQANSYHYQHLRRRRHLQGLPKKDHLKDFRTSYSPIDESRSREPTVAPTQSPTAIVTPSPSSAPVGEGATRWVQVGQDIVGPLSSTNLGYLVDLSDDGATVATSGGFPAGTTQIFEFNELSTTWSQLGQTLEEEPPIRSTALAASGRSIVVGTGDDVDTIAKVQVYRFLANSNQWVPIGQSIFEESNEIEMTLGFTVSISNNGAIIAVSDTFSVQAYAYDEIRGIWNALGQSIQSDNGALVGTWVDLSSNGRVLATGALGQDTRVFRYNSDSAQWEQLGQSLDQAGFGFWDGKSVAIDDSGFTVAIGRFVSPSDPGRVRIYAYNEVTAQWEQLGQDLLGKRNDDSFGWSISLDATGRVVAISGTGVFNGDPGYARVLEYNADTALWETVGSDFEGQGTGFGSATSLAKASNELTVAIGEWLYDDGLGRVQVFKYT